MTLQDDAATRCETIPPKGFETGRGNSNLAVKRLLHDAEQVFFNGSGAYIFGNEAALKARIARERKGAAHEAHLLEAVGRGAADIEASRLARRTVPPLHAPKNLGTNMPKAILRIADEFVYCASVT